MKIVKYIQGQEVTIDIKITATVNGKPLEIYAHPIAGKAANASTVLLSWSAEEALEASRENI